MKGKSTLSSDEVAHLLENIIHFKDWENLLQENKFEFLRKYTRHCVCHLYFQNIRMTSVSPEERHRPCLSDVIQTGLSGNGGVCVELNYFSRLILSSLGFNAISIQGTYIVNPIDGNHCSTLVRLSEDEIYLIDVGACLPGTEPVPLHKLPFNYSAAGFSQLWKEAEDGEIQRYQVGGKMFKLLNDEKSREIQDLRVKFLTLEPKNYEDYNDPMEEVFTNSKLSFLVKTLFLFRHLSDLEEEADQFVYVWGTTLLVGDENSRTITKYNSLEEMAPIIKKYFPNIDDHELKLSIKFLEEEQAYRQEKIAY